RGNLAVLSFWQDAPRARALLLSLGLVPSRLNERPELADGHLVDTQVIRPRELHFVLRTFPPPLARGRAVGPFAAFLVVRRAHDERAGRDKVEFHANGVL